MTHWTELSVPPTSDWDNVTLTKINQREFIQIINKRNASDSQRIDGEIHAFCTETNMMDQMVGSLERNGGE